MTMREKDLRRLCKHVELHLLNILNMKLAKKSWSAFFHVSPKLFYATNLSFDLHVSPKL